MSADLTQPATDRKGDWLQTFTGLQFWPLDPRPEEVVIEDIAHALAMLCRYGGHSQIFYSVAQHSVYVSEHVPPALALEGLLHDATEAYLVDVPRPVKKHLRDYFMIEQRVRLAIARKFNLERFEPAEIKLSDNAVMMAEKLAIMKIAPAPPWAESGIEPANINITYWSPHVAEAEFLRRFHQLTGS